MIIFSSYFVQPLPYYPTQSVCGIIAVSSEALDQSLVKWVWMDRNEEATRWISLCLLSEEIPTSCSEACAHVRHSQSQNSPDCAASHVQLPTRPPPTDFFCRRVNIGSIEKPQLANLSELVIMKETNERMLLNDHVEMKSSNWIHGKVFFSSSVKTDFSAISYFFRFLDHDLRIPSPI